MEREAPLRCVIRDGKLVIEIGIGTLAYAAERCDRFMTESNCASKKYTAILDADTLAEDVRRELEREEEDGSTPLTDLIDSAIEAAHDDGSLAFNWKDTPNDH